MSHQRHAKQPASIAKRTSALRDALNEKGLLPEGQLDTVLDATLAQFEETMNWRNGAKVVARAWTDPEYRARLLADGTAACAELGFEGPQGEYIVALEDEPELHHVIVCTQCSCTAWPVLGLPPDWYKSPEYRARVAREPRKVLHQMGLDVPETIEIRVWDTTAESRFIVLPLRPPATEGWSEEQLASIVTREAMIGVAMVTLEASAEK
ncbi:MAG: nitrile hydratase subunit alpha [Deltaproteobacteria bacterium]|nr:nitrile hydratase subunit alpha [Deltaproteobacteria bacterium]MBW2394091.1 nitrile hydratase subunit alpha [Deltaproteobacteria bacterium]